MFVSIVNLLWSASSLPRSPGQGIVEFVWQPARLLDQCIDHGLRFPVRDLREHQLARMAFNQGDDVAVVRSAEQVALPVTRHSPIFDRCRPLADRESIWNAAALISFLRCMQRAADLKYCQPGLSVP